MALEGEALYCCRAADSAEMSDAGVVLALLAEAEPDEMLMELSIWLRPAERAE